ncbi:MAG: Sec-independent protein translocase protein TatB [Sphingomonadales bacterium]
MFDIAGTELLLIVVIAIIVVGPKDLPRMMRAVGQAVRKIQEFSRQFRRQLDQMAEEAELEDIVAKANAAGKGLKPENLIRETLDPEHVLDEPILPDHFLTETEPEKPADDDASDQGLAETGKDDRKEGGGD